MRAYTRPWNRREETYEARKPRQLMIIHIWNTQANPPKAACGERTPERAVSLATANRIDATLLCSECAKLLTNDNEPRATQPDPPAQL